MEETATYHLFATRDQIRVLDSSIERLRFPALCGRIPMGHYRLERIERETPRSRWAGPGRITITDLQPADMRALVDAERAEESLDGMRFGGVSAPIGELESNAIPAASLCGGGDDSLKWSIAVANFQPLTPPDPGIRLRNADLEKVMRFLELRLKIIELVVLTVKFP